MQAFTAVIARRWPEALHLQTLGNADRSNVFRTDQCIDRPQLERVASVVEDRGGGFRCVTVAPCESPEVPADFHFRQRSAFAIGRVLEQDYADEQPIGQPLQCPSAIPWLLARLPLQRD